MRSWIGSWPAVRQLTGTDRLGLGPAARSKRTDEWRPRTAVADKVVKSICPYCAVGCGQQVFVSDGKVTQIEGDPDSPVSRGRDFEDTEDLDGVFSGLNAEHRVYDFETWRYQGERVRGASGARGVYPPEVRHERDATRGEAHGGGGGGAPAEPFPDEDETLQHPRCVFQVLKRHFARYTPEMVTRVAGVPEDLFNRVCRAITENSGPDGTTSFVHSLGWTQHTRCRGTAGGTSCSVRTRRSARPTPGCSGSASARAAVAPHGGHAGRGRAQ